MISGYFRGPAVLAVISICLILFSRTDFGDDWKPVSDPVDLTVVGPRDFRFVPRVDARYSLGVEVDWEGNAECLLGVRRMSTAPPCPVEQELDVRWEVHTARGEVTSGESRGFPGGSWGGASGIAASLDHFMTEMAEQEYRVTLTVLAPAPQLMELNPRLVVSIGGGERHSDLVPRALAFYGGAAGLLLALVSSAMRVWRRPRAR